MSRRAPGRSRPAAILLALAVALGSPAGPAAAHPAIPADLEAKLLLRILAFDRALAIRCPGDTLRIALVGAGGAEAERQAGLFAVALAAYGDKTVSGRHFVVESSRRCPEGAFAAVYLGHDLAREDLARCVEQCARSHSLTFAADPAYIEWGVAVAVRLGDSRPEILINRERSIAEGADFDPQLLLYSTLVSAPGAPRGSR